MALPTLQTYFSSRPSSALHNGNSRVQRIAEQTMAEDAKRKEWMDKSRYFRSSYVKSQKDQEWSSEKSLKSSLEKYKDRSKDKSGLSKDVDRRRKALKELLEQEKQVYEREIKERVSSDEYRATLKSRAEELRSAREDRRKEVAHQKMLDHWRLNCPELREVKSRQQERETHEKWQYQIQDKRKLKEAEIFKEQKYHEEMEKQRLQELEKQRKEEMERKREREELTLQLKKQMEEVRNKEKESVLIEQEQSLLMEEHRALYEAEEKRRQLQEQQQKTEFRRALTRQAKAKLRRRCQQVQESLALDLKILKEMAEKEREEQILLSSRKEKEKQDAIYMKKVIEEQLALEREREMELEMLYQEEAARMWQKREEQWEKEKEARQRLMDEVMEERQHQLEEKMEQLKILQKETIDQREDLLKQIEEANRLTEKENEIREVTEKGRQKEIKDQITERQRRREQQKLQQQWEEEQERLAQEEHDHLLQEEIANITSRGPHHHDYRSSYRYYNPSDRYSTTPPHSGRSPYAWY